MLKAVCDEANSKMDSSCETLKKDFKGLRTGRANVSILDGVVVNIYNSNMRLTQLATVSISGPKMLVVNVWDANNAEIVNKAIINSNIGLNSILEGAVIKVPLPEISEERRKELVKVANDYAERSKVAVRNVRRDAIIQLRALNKDKKISEDDLHSGIASMQKIIDKVEGAISRVLKDKEKDILNN